MHLTKHIHGNIKSKMLLYVLATQPVVYHIFISLCMTVRLCQKQRQELNAYANVVICQNIYPEK